MLAACLEHGISGRVRKSEGGEKERERKKEGGVREIDQGWVDSYFSSFFHFSPSSSYTVFDSLALNSHATLPAACMEAVANDANHRPISHITVSRGQSCARRER